MDLELIFAVIGFLALVIANIRVHGRIVRVKRRYRNNGQAWPFRSDAVLYVLLAFSPRSVERRDPLLYGQEEIREILTDRRIWLVFVIVFFVIFAVVNTVAKL